MTKSERYYIHGDGPYFVFDKKTNSDAAAIGFTTEAEAQALIDLLTRGKKDD
jgi:hypothetical protein